MHLVQGLGQSHRRTRALRCGSWATEIDLDEEEMDERDHDRVSGDLDGVSAAEEARHALRPDVRMDLRAEVGAVAREPPLPLLSNHRVVLVVQGLVAVPLPGLMHPIVGQAEHRHLLPGTLEDAHLAALVDWRLGWLRWVVHSVVAVVGL